MPAAHATGTLGILGSSELDRDALVGANTFGWYVQSGAVTFSATLTFNVAAVAAGDYIVNGTLGALYAGGTVTLTAQHASLPRVDIIVITAAGAVSAVAGTPAALTTTGGPVPTAPTSAQLEIARIYVPATGTALSAAGITDRRLNITPLPFDGTRLQFRANRYLVAEYNAQHHAHTFADSGASVVLNGPTGLGFYQKHVASDTIYEISGEPFAMIGNGAIVTRGGVYSGNNSGSDVGVLSPNHSPRILGRFDLPAASANLTFWTFGFFQALGGATANGAYLRLVTTGNLFFVTRQGGTETATDLGAYSRTTGVGFEIETVDAGVTWVCRTQAGVTLATHTTNVPTAATALAYGAITTTATGAIPFGAGKQMVWGTFA